ncbi:hypothetical protein [Dictyobacter kobayashii]|uniref:Uncharacterized protein n=1 Tax=Dictyobacter kobayashii TaxID=2014872 RepID=A0A402AQB4_9CHLR|nr:hypothetical protein [Dictyobacter kobayashii]GCE21225.1 hypothetical protein KDK_50250 [Dictyobacter kobayashii]
MTRYLDLYRQVTEIPASGLGGNFASHYLDLYRQISEPPDEEFAQWYQETYPDDTAAPALDFLRMHHKKFRDMVELHYTKGFMFRYLAKYQEKVYVVKNNADRARLLQHLNELDRRQTTDSANLFTE